jgi:hypothetical protein
MTRFFSAKNSKWINLSLVREITRPMDGLTLRFGESDTITLEGQDVQNCVDAVNQMNGYESPTSKKTTA